MAKVFANVCFWDVFVIFWMQCLILPETWGILHFVCAILGFVCKVLKRKRQSFENVYKQLKKKMNMCIFLWYISQILRTFFFYKNLPFLFFNKTFPSSLTFLFVIDLRTSCCLRISDMQLVCDVQHTMPQTLQPSVSKEQRFGWVLCPCDSHAVYVDEQTTPHISILLQSIFQTTNLLSQSRVQVKLSWELRYPVPDRERETEDRESYDTE